MDDDNKKHGRIAMLATMGSPAKSYCNLTLVLWWEQREVSGLRDGAMGLVVHVTDAG